MPANLTGLYSKVGRRVLPNDRELFLELGFSSDRSSPTIAHITVDVSSYIQYGGTIPAAPQARVCLTPHGGNDAQWVLVTGALHDDVLTVPLSSAASGGGPFLLRVDGLGPVPYLPFRPALTVQTCKADGTVIGQGSCNLETELPLRLEPGSFAITPNTVGANSTLHINLEVVDSISSIPEGAEIQILCSSTLRGTNRFSLNGPLQLSGGLPPGTEVSGSTDGLIITVLKPLPVPWNGDIYISGLTNPTTASAGITWRIQVISDDLLLGEIPRTSLDKPLSVDIFGPALSDVRLQLTEEAGCTGVTLAVSMTSPVPIREGSSVALWMRNDAQDVTPQVTRPTWAANVLVSLLTYAFGARSIRVILQPIGGLPAGLPLQFTVAGLCNVHAPQVLTQADETDHQMRDQELMLLLANDIVAELDTVSSHAPVSPDDRQLTKPAVYWLQAPSS